MNVGQKVVCVSDTPCSCCGQHSGLVTVGSVYVIRASELDKGRLWIKLIGITFPPDDLHESDWLDSADFRPLEEVQQKRTEPETKFSFTEVQKLMEKHNPKI